MSCMSSVDAADTPVVTRVLRSGVKVVQQPDRKKRNSSAPKGETTTQTPATLRNRPGPFLLGVSFTMSEVSGRSDWEYDKTHWLEVDMNSWLPVLCNIVNPTRSGTDLHVRVTAVLVTEARTLSFPCYHLIRLEGASLASYQQSSQGRHSVIFPISSSAITCKKIKFTSLQSDLGKDLKVVFCLEAGVGKVVGRRVFSVKIRAEQTPEIPVIEL